VPNRTPTPSLRVRCENSRSSKMKPRHVTAFALVGWYLMVPTHSKVQNNGGDLVLIQRVTDDPGFTVIGASSVTPATREFGDVTRPRKDLEDQAKAEALIAHNKWLLKIPHVTDVEPTVTFDEHNNYAGPAIAILVDKDGNITEVQRKIPSKLDGLSVVVMPQPTTPEQGVDLLSE
jgi:hypothetical protein